MFFCRVVFDADTEHYYILVELGDVSQFVAVDTLIVVAGVLVVAEFVDFAEEC